jgi:hypothetical protein
MQQKSNIDYTGLQFFAGGQSVDQKVGNRYEFYDSRHIDFRKNPNEITLLPKPRKISGGVVVDLVLDMCQLPDGSYYAIGDAGNLYKITAAGGWSHAGNIGENGTAGIQYRKDTDCVYISGTTKVARIKNVSTAPEPQFNWFKGGITTESNAYKASGSKSYTVITSSPETANAIRVIYPNITPIRKIGVQINNKGTGDWTLTLHDDANNVLATKTIANASLINNQVNFFEFSSPVDISVNTSTTTTPNSRPYHVHVTSTVADGTLSTTTAGSMADCDIQVYADALLTTINGFHVMERFINFTVIGNGRYVTVYEPLQDNPTTADYERVRIILPPGFEVCGFAQKNMMLIIGAEQRSSDGKFQSSALFFWNGNADTYVDWYPLPEGSPESLFSYKNIAWYIIAGQLTRIRGLDEPRDIRSFRGTDSEYSNISDVTHVYPHMSTVRRGILLTGFPSETTIQNLEHGVYSYGSSAPDFPDSFGNSYTPSHGVKFNDGSNNLRIGMVRNYVDILFISWRNGDTYGVDIVDNNSSPAEDGFIEMRRFDDDRPQFFKKANFLIATFSETLPSGNSVILKYKTETDSDWQYSTAVSSGTYAVFDIEKQFLHIDFGANITCEGSETLKINSIYLFFDRQLNQSPVNHG